MWIEATRSHISMLFNLVVEVLNVMINNVVSEGLLKGIELVGKNIRMFNLRMIH